MNHARRAGLYTITNSVTGARYFGSAQRLGVRRQRHFRDLRAGEHVNPHLQSAWNKYGEAAFAFTVLAVLERGEMREAEQRLLDKHYGREDCYNVSRHASAPMAGRRHSAATRARMSVALKGKPKSAETRAKMSIASLARPLPEGFSEMGAAARRGKPRSRDAVERSAAGRRGKKQSAETIAKRIAKTRGRKDRPEVIEAKRQRRYGPEARAHMCAAAQLREQLKREARERTQ